MIGDVTKLYGDNNYWGVTELGYFNQVYRGLLSLEGGLPELTLQSFLTH